MLLSAISGTAKARVLRPVAQAPAVVTCGKTPATIMLGSKRTHRNPANPAGEGSELPVFVQCGIDA